MCGGSLLVVYGTGVKRKVGHGFWVVNHYYQSKVAQSAATLASMSRVDDWAGAYAVKPQCAMTSLAGMDVSDDCQVDHNQRDWVNCSFLHESCIAKCRSCIYIAACAFYFNE